MSEASILSFLNELIKSQNFWIVVYPPSTLWNIFINIFMNVTAISLLFSAILSPFIFIAGFF